MKLQILLIHLLVPIAQASTIRDLRMHPCDRATIPWNPFTTHARLDPAALSRIISRTHHSLHVETKESIVLHKGKEDVVLVDYEVLLSDESLQTQVTLTQDNNDVAFVIDGTGVGSSVQRECVVSVTHVYLPDIIHHLIVDAQASNVVIDSVKSTFNTLEISLDAGSIKTHDSVLHADHFVADLKAGSISIDGGLVATSQKITTSAGHVRGNLIQGRETILRSDAGSIHVAINEPKDGSDIEDPRSVDISTEAGSIALDSRLVRLVDIAASAKYGSVSVSVEPEVSTRVHLEATLGHIEIPRSLVVTSDKRTWTSRMVDGYFGRSEDIASGTIRASSQAGSVHLTVPDDDLKNGL